jgi:PKHD-type hydroxylase
MIFPINPAATKNKDTHAYWEGFLSDEEINQILAMPEWLNTDEARIKTEISGNAGILNTNIRKTDICWMSPNKNNAHIWSKLSAVVSKINSEFFHFNLTGFYEPAQLGLYTADKQSYYEWHTDASPKDENVPRKLSMVLMLSDPSEFEGGELQLKTESDNPITLEQKRGRAWFFPSWVLHRVTPVTKGVRRSLVLWVGGPEFK